MSSRINFAKNTPIKELIEKYEKEHCNFSNHQWVINKSLAYVETLPDSQSRCLLYACAKLLEKEMNNKIKK